MAMVTALQPRYRFIISSSESIFAEAADQARDLFNAGQEFYDEGKFAEAGKEIS